MLICSTGFSETAAIRSLQRPIQSRYQPRNQQFSQKQAQHKKTVAKSNRKTEAVDFQDPDYIFGGLPTRLGTRLAPKKRPNDSQPVPTVRIRMKYLPAPTPIIQNEKLALCIHKTGINPDHYRILSGLGGGSGAGCVQDKEGQIDNVCIRYEYSESCAFRTCYYGGAMACTRNGEQRTASVGRK